ncbi:hypothetical protein [Maridesulfovibrio sp.]|uniref:hypothetical protein n=1 Tax=Maridesulfovibrio sp. TaxID=2795000 RepID=UPI002A18A71E|nr:hypothetical protein [Maridesulfovibrio sp.]
MPKKPEVTLHPVSELAKEADFPGWKLAALCRSAGWTMDKMVSQDEFDAALNHFENRKMGG